MKKKDSQDGEGRVIPFGLKKNPKLAKLGGVRKWIAELSHRLSITRVELRLKDPGKTREFRELLLNLPDWIDIGSLQVEARSEGEIYLAHRDWFKSLLHAGKLQVKWQQRREGNE